MDILKYLATRLREPSTWASIAALLVVAHVNVDPGLWATITAWGIIAAAALGVVLAETGSKTSGQIAEDVLSAILPLLEKQITPSISAHPAGAGFVVQPAPKA